MPIHILLADDHVVVRQGLKFMLEQAGFAVIAEAENGKRAIELAGECHPDVAILDVAMPILNGIDACREISKVSPRTRTILLTMLTDRHYVLDSLRAGVRGYVLKSRSGDELVRAIHEVSKGEMYLTPKASETIVQALLLAESKTVTDELTGRERQVLQLVAEGKTTKEIGVVLGISTSTAESHRNRIMEKLELHDTAGLVRYAVRHGLIQA